MKIYNSLTGKKENLELIKEGKVDMYVCGMTVYDDCHIGHARTFLSFDMIVRYLRSKGLAVNYIRNITDVDDKILQKSRDINEDPQLLTKKYIARMNSDFKALGMTLPDREPKATEHIEEIIKLISKLIDKGYAYHEESNVYFSVESFSEYGKLSNQKLDEIISGSRIEIDRKKRNSADFVLWKNSEKELVWDSPWGRGRPGWHIECSAMSMDSLGENFDIHAGGMDLKFPHHENEIAQSEASTGKKFANYWVHTGPLRIDKEKMSKSLDNVLTIREILKEYSAEILRFLLLSSHYRSPINFSEEGLTEAQATLDRLYKSILDLNIIQKEIPLGSPFLKAFQKAMDDDFNVPEALAVIFDLAKKINKAKEEKEINKASSLASELVTLTEPLGLMQQEPTVFLKSGIKLRESEIDSLIIRRNDLRNKGEYDLADNIRNELMEKNVVLEDSEKGTFWRRR